MKRSQLQQIIREEIRSVLKEKAVSQAQQQAAGIALAVKKGDIPASKLKDAGKAMSKMSEKELEKLAGTKHEGLPKKVKQTENVEESHSEHENYMFFQNLHTIKQMVDKMMNLNSSDVDKLLSAGHGWAVDHIATSTDDVSEVAAWLCNEIGATDHMTPMN